MKKVFFVITIIVLIIIVASMIFIGCFYKSWFGKRPCDQPNSNWATKDKTIVFSIDKNGAGTGQFAVDGEIIDFHLAIGPAEQIDIYSPEPERFIDGEIPVYGYPFEQWVGDFNKSYKFTATVKTTTYFEVGEKITFYRID